ncbi:hypothetical protein KUTeg_016862 [Tegillarca granosa]|uniref:ABC transporter domain-containing protein n=1 Tax=Tegillarca granosa TaxID=220873 RepID=A0ABQ9EQX6_TEGGR|nr:hypothetical protein KUTeg_016862 [Tegillarca granosa]
MVFILYCIAIIGRDMELFKKHLYKFIYAMPVYGLNELKLRFRTRLSYYLYSKYLKQFPQVNRKQDALESLGFTYYKMSNLDNRISNPDQLLTQDVDKFCDTVAELYSNLSKGPGVMLVYLAISGMILTRLRRPIGKLTVQEQRLEGEYRFVNSRLITNSEEIAFYQGNKREQGIILETFKRLVAHLRYFIFFRMQMGFLDNIIAKSGTGSVAFKPGSGKIVIQDHIIKFEKVPLVTPNGDVLIKELNMEVVSGKNVLVCGPNGCGKSSLFRILGELWPLFGGTMTKPEKGKLFYVPQVQLGYILDREGGWNAVQDWMDVLSGGEKQRVAMARLFYHKPQFAILDECTSAVSVDVEGYMYQHSREVGITLFTVSHRKSLWKHHEYYLMMDGRGAYEFKPISPDTTEFGS